MNLSRFCKTIPAVLPALLIGFASCESDVVAPSGAADGEELSVTESRILTPAQASEVASLFEAGRHGESSRSRGGDDVTAMYGEDGHPLAYVINNAGGGWVIVGASRDYYPILAYSEDSLSRFDAISMNPGVRMWIDDVERDIAASADFDSLTCASIALAWLPYTAETQSAITPPRPNPGDSEEAVKCRERMKYLTDKYWQEGWRFMSLSRVKEFLSLPSGVFFPSSVYDRADEVGSPYEYTIVGVRDVTENVQVGPLLTTEWSQCSGFNRLCPNYDPTNPNWYPAGCVAVAMGQIMKYHRHPLGYNWDAMPDSYSSNESAQLIANIGAVVKMNYGQDESGTTIENAKSGFESFGYKVDIKSYSYQDVRTELLGSNKPIFMGGKDRLGDSGHAWVCDGYKERYPSYQYYVEYLNTCNDYTNYGETLMENPGIFGGMAYTYFHMNWGWGKYDDINVGSTNYNGWYNNTYIKGKYKKNNQTENPDTIYFEYDFSQGRKNLFVKPK